MKSRVACLCVCAFLCMLGINTSLFGQSDVASVAGRVMDPNGAVIVEAAVSAKNLDTGVETTVQTNEEGIYRFASLTPGNYEFTVSKRGFKEIVKPGVTLHLADTISMNFNMVVGALTERVTVEAGASMINTTDASISTVVDQSYVKNMPLNGRSFQDLILLTPGVVTQSPQSFAALGQNGEFSVNGQRTESNYYTVDGVGANVGATTDLGNVTGPAASGSLPGATALGTTQALVSVDELQEFRVQSSTYSAEYGRNPGGQFAFETKSGTNQYHGTAYDYIRNDFFDSNDWFNDYLRAINPALTKPALRQNDFGGTFGGPVRVPRLYSGKDKTFFFVSYEGLRLTQPQPAIVNVVPDLCLRGQASACTGGNVPPAAAIQPALNAFPLPTPNGQNFGDGQAESIANWSNPASIDSTSVRFDHVLNAKVRLFFRFNDTSSNATTRGSLSLNGLTPSVNQPVTSVSRTYTGGIGSTFSSRLSNEFRLNYSSNEAKQKDFLDSFGGAKPIDMVQLSGLSGFGNGASAGFFLCYDACQQGELFQSVVSGAQRQWNIVDTLAFTAGRHQFKFGGDFRRLAPFAIPITAGLSYNYFTQSDVVKNNASFFSNSFGTAYPLFRNFSAFAQDEWRATPRLSLSMGLRWEVNPPPGVTQGLMPYTLMGSSLDTLTLAPQGASLYQTTWFNFAPRLGMAYVLRDTQGWETVVRAGGGVFFDTAQQLGSQGFFGPGFAAFGPGGSCPAQGTFPFAPSSNCSTLIPAITQPPSPPYDGVYNFSPHLQLPYTLQWNASVEQALGKSQTFTLSYVGSHAARLLQTNQFKPASNPNINFLFQVENGLTSDYDAMQLQFRRRLSQGLTALGSYSWSHCLDYGSSAISIGYQRGNCTWDVRHNFSFAFSYDVPNAGHNGVLGAIVHHWGIDDRFMLRTAFPVSLLGSSLPQPNGKVYNAGLSLVPGQPLYLYGANCASVLQGLGDLQAGQGCPGGKVINPNAFMQPAVCPPSTTACFGDAPRNFARGFGAWQMDFAIRREFPIHENLKLQFRTEAFNLFNHPNFGQVNAFCAPNAAPATGCLNPQFGQATGTLASTLGVLSSQYQMGGPRSMQFALKLIF